MGDFLGFTFNGEHSSDMGITRISSGDDFSEELFPEMEDITADVPGLDGQYYFGTKYNSRSFDIEFAFDHLTEVQFRRLRQIFGTKKSSELIFDERPYKKYLVRINSPIELSFICFDEKTRTTENREGVRVINRIPITEEVDGEEVVTGYTVEREPVTPYVYLDTIEPIYKGKGKMTCVCYYPFAKSVFKALPVGDNADWAASSGILSEEAHSEYDNYDSTTGEIKLYNAGDLSTGFRLYCPFSASTSLKLSYTPITAEGVTAQLNINTMTPQTNGTGAADVGILVNTDNGLVQGVQEFGLDQSGNAIYITSGNIYNRYIDSGYFFKIDPSIRPTDGKKLAITNINDEIINSDDIYIFYDYLYF